MKVLILLLVLATMMQAGRTRASPRTLPGGGVAREGERRLCGWRLANELNRVCKGVYNKPTVSTNANALFYLRERGGKRVDVWPLKMEFPPWTQAPVDELRADQISEPHPAHKPMEQSLGEGQRLPFLTGAEASRMLGGSPRVKRGLSAECCRKACSVSELAGYCY